MKKKNLLDDKAENENQNDGKLKVLFFFSPTSH